MQDFVAQKLPLLVAQSFSLLLPIFVSGLFFILCMKKSWLRFLDRPIDGGKSFGGAPIFGSNKNWRGPAVYVVLGTLVTVLLGFLSTCQTWVSPVFGNQSVLLGFLLTVSYSSAELVNSFIKRRLGIAPGKSAGKLASFFDNTDGALASGLVYFLFGASLQLLALSFVLSLVVHASTDVLMRKLRLKQSK